MGDDARSPVAEYAERYKLVEHPALLRAERRVIGADYGATSYTTRDQADRLARTLGLGRSQSVLDIGSGAGWPGLYLGRTTGCRVVLIDLPFTGLRVSADRARRDGVDGIATGASGDALPFKDGSFDAVTSSDVLC